MQKLMRTIVACLVAMGLGSAALADNHNDEGNDKALSSSAFSGFKLRGIGPAFMSGRISDIAIKQDDPATWYVAVGSGGVWKTENAGTTWKSLFDGQGSYSIGTVVIDPTDSSRIWVGTGENTGGRHNAFGDGIYLSEDGGQTWTNMGLKDTHRISKIIVHPEDQDTIWVAAQGSLWAPGGQRGVYKTTDGGKTWENVLRSGPYTGATDMLIDPRDPDRLYAATWQHHRTVAAYVGGGPESGLWRSDDGGETWDRLKTGLPSGNMGKIGLAISSMQPDVLYAAIELDLREGGVWRSDNRGSSWTKMSDEVAKGTGPHYYQEIFASPHHFDRIYLVSNTSQTSYDGGKTWEDLNNSTKHVDDHAIAFRPDDPDYIIYGSDGGLYESYDHTKTWRYIDNLPITQFYKVAVDDAVPFYNVYGGTQDNNSQGGPSRTDNSIGIRNSDWFVTLGGDGHQSATEPGNPDIVYAQSQQGNLARIDRITGEAVAIQPQARPGEPVERWNWDSPILVSQHNPTTIYFASQRVWKSTDRGDSWTAVSGDLTRNQNRLRLPVQGRQWSWEAGWDLLAMSQYNTITSLGESPIDPNILYAGTDDGLIQMSSDGGQSWRRMEVGALPGVPATAFVNDIRADLFDADTVYIALDNHKYGDYTPYLLKSTDRGRSWRSIKGNIPDRHLMWRIVQDHVNPNLLFTATEFGLFFTLDGGMKWTKLTGDAPTISFRDVTIQRTENDLVGATFGRGFYILDDITPLRSLTEASLNQEAMLFPGRDAWWYFEKRPMGQVRQGDGFFMAPNPPFGANFTYYLKDSLPTRSGDRKAAEGPLIKQGEDTPFPEFSALTAELQELAPGIWLTVRDSEGNVVRRIKGPGKKGFNRINWDLRYPNTISLSFGGESGFLAPPGDYTVSLSKMVDGRMSELVGPKRFTVKPLRQQGALPNQPDTLAFWEDVAGFARSVIAADSTIDGLDRKIEQLGAAALRARSGEQQQLENQWLAIRGEYLALDAMVHGDAATGAINERQVPTFLNRLQRLMFSVSNSQYGPTQTQREQLAYSKAEFAEFRSRVKVLVEQTIPAFERTLIESNAPWVPGAGIP